MYEVGMNYFLNNVAEKNIFNFLQSRWVITHCLNRTFRFFYWECNLETLIVECRISDITIVVPVEFVLVFILFARLPESNKLLLGQSIIFRNTYSLCP